MINVQDYMYFLHTNNIDFYSIMEVCQVTPENTRHHKLVAKIFSALFATIDLQILEVFVSKNYSFGHSIII